MSRDPWIQRFDERADEDDRYARRLEEDRADRAAEKGDGILSQISSNVTDGGMTIEEFERSVEAGLRGFRGPKTLPPDVVRAMEAFPPLPPPGPHESKAFIALGWVIGGIIALVLALAIATAIFMGVAWALGPGS